MVRELTLAVEGRCLGRARPTGVDRYATAVLEHLAEEQPSWSQIAVVPRGPDRAPPPHMQVRHSALTEVQTWRATRYAITPPLDLVSGTRADVWLFPDFVRAPLAMKRPSVSVVYDLSFVRHPELADARNGEYLRTQVPRTLRSSTSIVAVSDHCRREIHDVYRVPLEAVTVVPPGVDLARFRPEARQDVAGLRQRLGLPATYVLHVGTLEPRKNVERLIAAHRMLSRPLREQFPLVLAGKLGWRSEGVEVALAVPDPFVQHLEYVSDDDLLPLHAGASLFALVSLYEGFGVPLLEAMASQVACLTSRTSSMPEVVGDAGMLIDPTSTADIAAALRALLEDEDRRRTMAELGRLRAQRYTWSTAARRLADVITAARG